MLWSAHYEDFPEFDRLLDDDAKLVEVCSLERLFAERGFLQELNNSDRLQKFLAKRRQLEKLIAYAFDEYGSLHERCELAPEVDEGSKEGEAITRARAAHLSVEVLVSNSWVITQAITSDPEMLALILKTPFSRSTPLKPKVAERLGRVIGHLLSRGSAELGAYVRDEWEQIQRFLTPCLSDAYLSELMLRLWAVSCPHSETTSQRLAEDLVAHLSPASNDELVREAACHFLNELMTLPSTNDSAQHPAIHIFYALLSPSLTDQLVDCLIDPAQPQGLASKILALITTLLQWPFSNGALDCMMPYERYVFALLPRAEMIHSAANPASLAVIETSTGMLVPIGSFRLRVAEFWAQLLRTATTHRSEDLAADLSQLGLEPSNTISGAVCQAFLRNDVFGWALDLLHEHPWHNLFHHIVYELIHILLTWPQPPAPARRLLVELFTRHKLVGKLITGHRKGSHAVGYLGHFALIGEDLLHFYGQLKSSKPNYGSILQTMREQGWQAYLEEYLLPVQAEATGVEEEGSLFGEFGLRHITPNRYLDADDDLDEIDSLEQPSLESTIELEIDLQYEDDDEDKVTSQLPIGGNEPEGWIQTPEEFFVPPDSQLPTNGWLFERCEPNVEPQPHAQVLHPDLGPNALGDPVPHTEGLSFFVDQAEDDEGLGIKLDVVRIPRSLPAPAST